MRVLRTLKWLLLTLVTLLVLAVSGVFIGANTKMGQQEIARLIGQVTAGQVVVQDIGGRFPDRLSVGRISISDAKGVWLSLADVALDWSPLRLLQGEASVQLLAAGAIDVTRLPVASGGADTSGGGSFALPVRVSLAQLKIDRLRLEAPVAGAGATVALAGSAQLGSLQQGTATLDVTRLDGAGHYHVAGSIDPARITAELHAAEPSGGLVSGLAGLPDLGAITADATLAGPRDAVAAKLDVAAGALRAAAEGTVDLVGMAADLHVTASAPAMAPRPDVAWQSVAVDARVSGPFARPDAKGSVRIEGLAAGGAAVRAVALDVSGNQGSVALEGSLTGVRLPGPRPDLLGAAPVSIAATARLDQPGRPMTLRVSHPLLALSGDATLAPTLAASVTARLPDLTPLAALGGVDVQGTATLSAKAMRDGDQIRASADGDVAITGGMAPLPGLIGDAKLALAVAIDGDDITIDRADITGRTLTAAVTGADKAGVLALDWKAALSNLTVLAPTLAGHVAATGTLAGAPASLTAAADVDGEVTTQGVASGPLHASLRAAGLPAAPRASLTAAGAFAGAPIKLAASATRDAGGLLTARIDHLDWQSAHADGAVSLAAGASLPTGRLNFAMTHLDQLRALVGTPVMGSVEAHVELPDAGDVARLSVTGTGLGVPGDSIANLDVTAAVTDPMSRRLVDLKATATGIAAAGVAGNLRLQASGPQSALAVKLSADGRDPSGQPAQATAGLTIDATARTVLLSTLTADWHGLAPRLLAPARLDLADGVAVDRLRVGLGAASLEVAGKLSPRLDANISLHNLTPALAQPFAPGLAADGTAQLDAHLTGAPARPDGQVKLTATGLRLRTGPARSLPPAAISATANLAGGTAQLDASVTAGKNRLALAGTAPEAAAGPLALRLTGGIDLTLLDPILTAAGRRVRGQVVLDAAIDGTIQAPRIDGTVRLANGEVQDFTQGVHLTEVTATLVGSGSTLHIQHFTAKAGAGTVAVTGTVGALQPDIPLDLGVTARNARLLASDRMTAVIDADVTLKGNADSALAAAGKLIIDSADIRIPESLPVSVVSLNVIRAGQKPPPPPGPGLAISLALDVNAPNPVFVRGRGLDAELEGAMKIGGTAAAPIPSGGLTMRRGTFSVAGTTLSFTKGSVQFGGASISDPAIDFVATSANSSVTANLEISGSASHPKITLSSTPDLPQDEVLSQLLFGTSESQLSPFQIAGIAQTLAQFSGVSSGLTNPLESIRTGLGLDRLSVGSGANGPALQAGRYVATGVYVGAKQALGSSRPVNGAADPSTQATVQIDITKRLKVEGDVGTGQGANAVGLTYQFEY